MKKFGFMSLILVTAFMMGCSSNSKGSSDVGGKDAVDAQDTGDTVDNGNKSDVFEVLIDSTVKNDDGGVNDPGTTTDPGVTTDPGTQTDPGTTTDPGNTTDPGTTTDPGSVTDPGVTPDEGTPTDPGTATDSGQSADGTADGTQPQYTMVKDIQSGDTSTTCLTGGKYDKIGPVALKKVIVTSPLFSASATLNAFYVADYPNPEQQYSGILITVKKDKFPDLDTWLAPGKLVSVEGTYKEFYCFSEIDANTVTDPGDTGTVPAPIPLDPNLLANGGKGHESDLEPYEGELISLEGPFTVVAMSPVVATINNKDKKTWFAIAPMSRADDSPVIYVDSQALYGNTDIDGLDVGATIGSIKGAMLYHYVFQIAPLSHDDINITTPAPSNSENAEDVNGE